MCRHAKRMLVVVGVIFPVDLGTMHFFILFPFVSLCNNFIFHYSGNCENHVLYECHTHRDVTILSFFFFTVDIDQNTYGTDFSEFDGRFFILCIVSEVYSLKTWIRSFLWSFCSCYLRSLNLYDKMSFNSSLKSPLQAMLLTPCKCGYAHT